MDRRWLGRLAHPPLVKNYPQKNFRRRNFIRIDGIDRVPPSHLAQARRRGLGDYWGGEDYDYYDYPDPGVIDEPPPPPDPWDNLTDNGDGSFTDSNGDIYDAAGIWLGFENDDGTWTDPEGNVWTIDNTPAFDPTFEVDPETGLVFDHLSGSWYAIDGAGNPILVSENPDGPSFEELAAARGIVDGSQFAEPPGILQTIGNFFGKLFGGSGGQGGGNFGGGGGGGGSMSSGQKQQAETRANQAAQQLAQARAQGATAATIQNLERQLALAQAVAAKGAGLDWGKTILVAVTVGAVTYAIASRRPPPPTPPNP
jgi:hypothetical protein